MTHSDHLFEIAARLDKLGTTLTRAGLVIVLLWIGGLKVYKYEGEGSSRSWRTARP